MPQSMIDALNRQKSESTERGVEAPVATERAQLEVGAPVIEPTDPVITAKSEEKPAIEAAAEKIEEPATETTRPATEVASDHLWFDKPASGEVNTANNPQLEVDYKAKYMEIEDILKRPEVAVIVDAVKNNVPIDEVLDKIKRVDYSKMSADGVIAQFGKLKNRTDEQIESDKEMFASLTVSAQDRELEYMQQKLDAAQNERLKGLFVVDPKKVEQQKAVESRLVSEVQQRATAVGKEILGITITKQDIEEYQNWVYGGVIPTTADGFYDEQRLWKQFFGEKYLSLAVSNVAKSAKAEGLTTGRKETLEKVHNPSDNGTTASRIPQAAPPLSDAEKARKGFAQHMGIPRSN